MDEHTQERWDDLGDAITRIEAFAVDNPKLEEPVAEAREAFDALQEQLGEEEKAARRRGEEDEEEYGYAKPKKRQPVSKAEAAIDRLARGTLQKSAVGALTYEQAYALALRQHPELYEDQQREMAELRRRRS